MTGFDSFNAVDMSGHEKGSTNRAPRQLIDCLSCGHQGPCQRRQKPFSPQGHWGAEKDWGIEKISNWGIEHCQQQRSRLVKFPNYSITKFPNVFPVSLW